MKLKKAIATIVLPLALCALPGCTLIPEEETFGTAPVIREYAGKVYKTTFVAKGELESTASLYCKYEPVKESKLSFGVGGLYYDTIYVEKGDYVTEGTLLAELQMGTLADDIANAEYNLAGMETSLADLEELIPLELERYGVWLDTLSPEEREKTATLEEKREEYELQRRDLEDKIYIQKLRLGELNASRDERRIVADMDGTVMYIRSHKDGETSVENNTFLKISDTESSMFTCSTEYYDLFKPGDLFEVTVQKNVYPVEVVSAETLGLPAPEVKDNKSTVYFKLLEPAVDLESGDRGTLVLLLESRPDTLYVTTKAVTFADGHYYVYYVNENNIRCCKEIQVGLQTNSFYEVLDGLSEGEEIILP